MDNFALLGQPRQPWLDPDSLKAAFLEISARRIPTAFQRRPRAEQAAATGRYAELNAAYNCLREPKQRLLHLLELESGAPPANVQDIPPGTMDLFMEIGQVCREADGILAAKAGRRRRCCRRNGSSRAWHAPKGSERCKSESSCGAMKLLAELKAMNAAWNAAPPPALLPAPARCRCGGWRRWAAN